MTANLIITPVDGEFDIAAIRAWLDSKPYVFEGPHEPNTFYIMGLPSTVDFAFEMLSADPQAYPRCCEAHIEPTVVYLLNEHGHTEDRRNAAEFFEWIISTTRCRVGLEGMRDITDEVRELRAGAVYREDERTQPLAVQGTLINIGRFRELSHGWSAGPSLERACRNSAGPDDERIAAYLEAGHLYERAGEETQDYFDRQIALGSPHLLTDGVYVWPADLPYYVRTYHVALPRAFAIHARNNGWRMPTNVDIAALPSLPF